jgi:uncharacterized membrane protein
MNEPLTRARDMALALHLLLVVALAVWSGWPGAALLTLPLLLPLKALWCGSTRAAAATAMVLTFYVAGLLAEGVAQPARRVPGEALAGLAALDFLSLILFVRLSARVAAARKESSAGAGR